MLSGLLQCFQQSDLSLFSEVQHVVCVEQLQLIPESVFELICSNFFC